MRSFLALALAGCLLAVAHAVPTKREPDEAKIPSPQETADPEPAKAEEAQTKKSNDFRSVLAKNTIRAMRIAVPKNGHVDQTVESVASHVVTDADSEAFAAVLKMFDHDDDGKLTFDELVDTKKALDTLTSFSEKGPKGIKPSLPLPDLIKTGGVLELETKRLEETNKGEGVQITYNLFEDRFSHVLADSGAVFKKLDGNKDEELSDDELQELVTYMPDHLSYLDFSKWYHLKLSAQPDGGDALFDELDLDNDDVVSQKELSKMHKHDKKGRGDAMDQEMFNDLMGDTIAEHTKKTPDEVFALLDVNGNGVMDTREVIASEVMTSAAVTSDAEIDFDANPHKANQLRKGRLAGAKPLQSSEFNRLFRYHFEGVEGVHIGEAFAKIDTDKDGIVDTKEIKALTTVGAKMITKFPEAVFSAWYFDKFKDMDQLQKTFVLMDGNEDKALDTEELEFIREDLNGPAMVPVDMLMHDPWMGMSFKVFDNRFLNNLVGVLDKKGAHKTLDKDANGILTRSELNKIGEVLPEKMDYKEFMYWHEERMYMGGAVPGRGFNDDEMEMQYKDIDLNADKILQKSELIIYTTPSEAQRDEYREYARRAIKQEANPEHEFDALSYLGMGGDEEDQAHDPSAGVGMYQFMHYIAPHLSVKGTRGDELFNVLDTDQDMHLSSAELSAVTEFMHDL